MRSAEVLLKADAFESSLINQEMNSRCCRRFLSDTNRYIIATRLINYATFQKYISLTSLPSFALSLHTKTTEISKLSISKAEFDETF